MKNLLTIISFSIFLFSCAEKETVSNGLEGVWKKIGTTIYKDGKPSDTLSPMYDRTNKNDREGYQYKIYSKKNVTWLRRVTNLDSAGNNMSYGTGASGTYEVKNDTLFEILKQGVDRWREIYNEGRVFKFALNTNQNNFEQFRIDEQGNGFGELYERIDTYNQSNLLSGVYKRDATLVYEKNKVVDTLSSFTNSPNFKMKLILTDNFYSLIWNYDRLDSLGNDTFDVRMILANATYDNSRQYLSIVAGLRPITNQWREKFNNKRERDIGLTDDNNLLMGLLGSSASSGSLDEDGNGRKAYFKRIE
tara:strand:+ start:361 stop:1275 length:915 start_codon:yes stop_codon:yes gene_type:complete